MEVYLTKKSYIEDFFLHKTLMFLNRVIEYHVITTQEGCIEGNFWEYEIDLHNSDL